MGYRHIDNLYKNKTILNFRECYALEKVHGTSAHITFRRDGSLFAPEKDEAHIGFFAGGASHLEFIQLFNVEELKTKFLSTGINSMTIYGEAYGGKMQGMRHTYGDKLQFIAFEVKIGDKFLGVEQAFGIVQKMDLEFVPFRKISTDIESLDAERDLPSRVAVRRGITEPKISEGVVLRPPIEVGFENGPDNNFGRIIAKHKRSEFSERTSKKDTVVDNEKLQVLTKANEIADEWVTPMRLEHVLDKFRAKKAIEMSDTPYVLDAMVEDVLREAKGEIVSSKEAIHAIKAKTAKMFKKIVTSL